MEYVDAQWILLNIETQLIHCEETNWQKRGRDFTTKFFFILTDTILNSQFKL